MRPESRPAEPKQPAPHGRRTLILANARAGSLARRERWRRAYLRGRARAAARLRLPPPADPDPLAISLAEIAHLAAEAGLEADVELVPPMDEIPERVRSAAAEGYDVVAAAGGDGTIHTIAQPLVSSNLCLGVLPLGTANNIARALNIPLSLAGGLEVLARGEELRVDVGWVADEYFLEAAGVGLFADAISAFGAEEPRRYQIRRLARVLAPLLWNLRARTLELKLDGAVHHEELVMVLVANGRYIGEGMSLAPEAALTDGLFDVVMLRKMGRIELAKFGLALLRGARGDKPQVRRAEAETVEIRRVHRAHRPLPVHADDRIVARTPARMDTLPKALRVIAPANGV